MKIVMVNGLTTRAEEDAWALKLTLAGHVVIPHAEIDRDLSERERVIFELIRFCAIADADAVFVLDKPLGLTPAGEREIAWARLRGKGVFWFSNGGGARLIGAFAALRYGETALQPDSGLASVSRETRRARGDAIVEALGGKVQEDRVPVTQDEQAVRMLADIVRGGVKGDVVCDPLNFGAAPTPRVVSAVANVRSGE